MIKSLCLCRVFYHDNWLVHSTIRQISQVPYVVISVNGLHPFKDVACRQDAYFALSETILIYCCSTVLQSKMPAHQQAIDGQAFAILISVDQMQYIFDI